MVEREKATCAAREEVRRSTVAGDRGRRRRKMVLEYLQWCIEKSFKAEERDKANEERLTRIHEGTKGLKEQWQMPIKSEFYWKSKRAQAKYAYDSQPALKKMTGRRGPYD